MIIRRRVNCSFKFRFFNEAWVDWLHVSLASQATNDRDNHERPNEEVAFLFLVIDFLSPAGVLPLRNKESFLKVVLWKT